MEVNGDGYFFPQRLHQFECCIRLAQPGHILDSQEMGAQLLKLLGQPEVIFERVLRPAFVQNVAGIANRGFTHRARFERRVNGHAHVVNGIERIEDAENVDALGVSFTDEFNDDIIGIRGVTHGVCAAQEHLKANIGNALAENTQPVPRIFMQEAHGSIERRASPHFQAEELRQSLGHGIRGGEQIVRAHARGHQRLVRVAKSRVGEQQSFFFARPGREFPRAQLFQELAGSRRGRDSRRRWYDRDFQFLGDLLAFHFRVAV